MNTISKEAKLLLEQFGVTFPNNLPYPSDTYYSSIGFYKGFCVYFKNYYYVITGAFQLSKIQPLYENREFIKHLEIRPAGLFWDTNPAAHAQHKTWDKLTEDFLGKWLTIEDAADRKALENKITKAHEDLIFNEPGNCFLHMYHIDTIEGVIYMLKHISSEQPPTVWG